MKTLTNKSYFSIYVFLVIILSFSICNSFSAPVCNDFKTTLDSLEYDSTTVSTIDTTTFGNHFYQRLLLGNSDLLYKNFGAVTECRKHDDQFLESGFEKYNSLLWIVKSPINATSSSYIKYLSGTKTEQIFCGGFNQTIFKRFMMMGDYRSIVSPGFFQNQSSKIQNYFVGLAYQSKNDNYRALFSYDYSKALLGVNGGLETDSSLKNISNNQGNGLSINLVNSKIKLKQNCFNLEQSLNLNKRMNDTLTKKLSLISLNKISHTSSYQRFVLIHSSATINDDFYQNIFYDSTSTYDSVFVSRLTNTLNFTFNVGSIPNNSVIDFFYKNEIIQYDMHENNTDLFIQHAGTSYNYFGHNFAGRMHLEYCYNDDLKSAMSFNAGINKKFSSGRNAVFADFLYEGKYPSLISVSYFSNHFKWDNKFKNRKNGMLTAGLNLANDVIKLSLTGRNFKDYIYYNTEGLPVQYGGDIKVISTEIVANYNFYRNWNFYSETKLNTSDNEDIYAVPRFTSYSSVYYERSFFKKAMKASIGAGCLYFTSYFADVYMPATSQFQRQKAQEIGNYPFVDFFVNMRIRSAKLFLKIEHLNMGFGNAQYFYLPHQPTPGRTLKLGIDWTFLEDLKK